MQSDPHTPKSQKLVCFTHIVVCFTHNGPQARRLRTVRTSRYLYSCLVTTSSHSESSLLLPPDGGGGGGGNDPGAWSLLDADAVLGAASGSTLRSMTTTWRREPDNWCC